MQETLPNPPFPHLNYHFQVCFSLRFNEVHWGNHSEQVEVMWATFAINSWHTTDRCTVVDIKVLIIFYVQIPLPQSPKTAWSNKERVSRLISLVFVTPFTSNKLNPWTFKTDLLAYYNCTFLGTFHTSTVYPVPLFCPTTNWCFPTPVTVSLGYSPSPLHDTIHSSQITPIKSKWIVTGPTPCLSPWYPIYYNSIITFLKFNYGFRFLCATPRLSMYIWPLLYTIFGLGAPLYLPGNACNAGKKIRQQ